MDDLTAAIAHLDALRPTFGDAWVDARIAELRATALPAPQQSITAGDESAIVNPLQVSARGDVRDNVVLRDITIAANGMLVVGAPPSDLPPSPTAIQSALTHYLETLLERYQLLPLHGLGAGSNEQVRIALRAVFINLRTNVTIGEAATVFGPEMEAGRQMRRGQWIAPQPSVLSADLRQWIAELLSDDEQAVLLNLSTPAFTVYSDPVRARLLAPRTALELIRHHQALVLLGNPGSGKTTVLRHLALGFAHARLTAGQAEQAPLDPELAWNGPLPLPILVQLRRFAEELATAPDNAGPLLDHIERVLSGERLEALTHHLVERLEAGNVMLLLDGLDEVADDTRRARVVQAVTRFQSRFPHSRIVLTSRTYAYRDPYHLPPPFQEATLQPLDGDAQDAFIGRWYRAALLHGSALVHVEQTQVAAQKARDLIAALGRRPQLREVAASPLLLTMIALLHLHGLGLPQQRAELYQACLLLLLEQWEQRRAEGEAGGLAMALGLVDRLTTTGERLALIQPVAYQLQMLGREEACQAEVKQWLLDRFLDLADEDGKRAKTLIARFLSFLEGRSGLLIARDLQDSYMFPHKTFQEYLAARELIYQGAEMVLREVLERRHAANWREVILLVAGHLVANSLPQQAKEIAWKLLDADPAGSAAYYRSVALAGEIVEELGSNLGRDGRKLRDEVVQALVELVQGGQLSARERVDAAFVLGRLGDPRLPAPDQPAYWCAVAAGPFWYGDDRENTPLQQVALPYDFKIARYLVTNVEYQRFIDADGYNPKQPWWTPQGRAYLEADGVRLFGEDKGKRITLPQYWHDTQYNQPTQPVIGVSWYEAAAYCAWLTAQGYAQGWLPTDAEIRLPTSLEWERAARHTDQRRYPWGDDPPDAERANYQETSIGRPSPVGCFATGVAECGALDMIGNTIEWLATLHVAPFTFEAQKDVTPELYVMLAYSDFTDEKEQLCSGVRDWNYPNNRYTFRGFRVVQSLATHH